MGYIGFFIGAALAVGAFNWRGRGLAWRLVCGLGWVVLQALAFVGSLMVSGEWLWSVAWAMLAGFLAAAVLCVVEWLAMGAKKLVSRGK
ncbi:hypothetical protein [Dechloromonas sp. A34]|uniref:hypothetical protein n=1 Tax=Dechloromonas sp. A34 TaxID=447588 RepID=UPI002249039C|nr:hypothetical protein [Dechloromonas sp. A34]